MRPIGHTQMMVLKALNIHGSWTTQSEWTWMGYSDMRKTLETLVARGLVIKRKIPQKTSQCKKSWMVVYSLPPSGLENQKEH